MSTLAAQLKQWLVAEIIRAGGRNRVVPQRVCELKLLITIKYVQVDDALLFQTPLQGELTAHPIPL